MKYVFLYPKVQKAISEICDYLFARVMNRYMDQFSSIHAASTDIYQPIDKLHTSYNQTLHLLKEKIFITKSCIIKSDMCNEPDAKKAELLFTMLERLKRNH